MDEKQIIELYFARNEQAIKETDAKYGRLCRSISYNILQNEQDVEECVNDTYLGVWNAIPPQKPNNLRAFVCKIARNLSLKRLSSALCKKRSDAMVVSLGELEEILPDDKIASNIDNEHIGKMISEFLRKEKENVRNVFIRKYWFFDSIENIAKRYSFTEGKVKSMLYNTRRKLKEFLIKEGVEI